MVRAGLVTKRGVIREEHAVERLQVRSHCHINIRITSTVVVVVNRHAHPPQRTKAEKEHIRALRHNHSGEVGSQPVLPCADDVMLILPQTAAHPAPAPAPVRGAQHVALHSNSM